MTRQQVRLCASCGRPRPDGGFGDALMAELILAFTRDVLGCALERLCGPCWAEFTRWALSEGAPA